MKWAESNGYKGSFSEICKLEGLKEYILKELAAVAQKNKLRGFEYIKGIVLDPIPFDIERDLVTATMKKRRNNMLKYYQSEIDTIYKKLETQKNAAKAN
jgi:long-chain acyl-CoA synthetase